MVRLVFPDEGSRLIYRVSGTSLAAAPSVAAVFYTDAAATTLADLRVHDGTLTPGAVIAGSAVTTDAYSRLPLFWGPDGVDTLYVVVAGGPASPVYARGDDRLDVLTTADTTEASARAAADTAEAAARTAEVATEAAARAAADTTEATARAAADLLALPRLSVPKLPIPRPKLEMVTIFQAGHGWTTGVTAGGTVTANDTVDYILGTQSVSGTSPTSGGVNFTRNAAMAARNMTTRYVAALVKVDRPDLMLSITVRLGTGNMAAFRNVAMANGAIGLGSQALSANEWAWVYSNQSNSSTGVGTPDLTAITDIQIRMDNAGTGAVKFNVAAIATFTAPPAFPNGVVTLSFDDSWASQFSLARPKLDQYGFPATAYTIVDALTGESNMTLANLNQLRDSHRWQIAGHAYTAAAHNAGYSALSAAALDTEVSSLRQWLGDNGFDWDHFAWPLGDDGNNSRATLRKHFTFARHTAATPFGSLPPDQPLKMRAFMVGTTPTPTTIQGYIDSAYTNRNWLHLTWHQIVASGASGAAQTNVADFNTVVDYLATKGIPVMTAGEVIRALNAVPAT